jgi:hypothetical protein
MRSHHDSRCDCQVTTLRFGVLFVFSLVAIVAVVVRLPTAASTPGLLLWGVFGFEPVGDPDGDFNTRRRYAWLFFFEEAVLMMKLPKRYATPWKGGRLAPITDFISRG